VKLQQSHRLHASRQEHPLAARAWQPQLRKEEELAGIYVARGLDRALADQVAAQLMAQAALAAHARDELAIVEL